MRIGLLLVPVAIVLSMPPVTLGTYAASRRSSFGGLSSAFTPDDFEHGPLTMVHVAAAERELGGPRRASVPAPANWSPSKAS